MTKKKIGKICKSKSAAQYLVDLRSKAEERYRAEDALGKKEPTAAEKRRMLHELQVHQVELEMQNDELRRTQAELETSRARYFDLYDLAPVGYCTISEPGLILEANLTAAGLLGEARGALPGQPFSRFIHKEDQDTYYLHRKQLFDKGEPQVCELRLVNKDGKIFWARLEATTVQKVDCTPSCRVVISDISVLKSAEAAQKHLITELENALAKVTVLSGLLPICAGCKKIRDDQGYWRQVELYIQEHSDVHFTHSMCPECMEEYYPKKTKK